MTPYVALILGLAIISEVIATSALKLSDGFTRLTPSLVTLVGYAIAIYLLSLTLRTIPVGLAYALWSGIGIVFIAIIGLVWFKQTLDLPAVVGIALILAGVVIVNGFSKSIVH
jgi:small multidrug resistance pump